MQKQLSQIEIIKRFAVSLIRQNSLDDLLWEIAKNIGTLVGYEDCVIYLVENDYLTQRAAYGIKNPDQREIKDPIKIKIGDGICGNVALTGLAELIADTDKDPRYIPDLFHGRSEITVPIIVDDEVIGIIDSEAKEANFFNEEDLELLQSMANIAACRIASAISKEETAQARNQNEVYRSLLKNERVWLKTVVNSIRDGIIATDHDLNVQMLSQSAQQLTGWASGMAIGRSLREVFNLSEPADFKDLADRQEIRSTLIDHAGETHRIAWSINPITYEGNRIGWVVVFRDTQRESFLEREAEKAQRIESLGLLAGGIAHDFNNNLQAMLSSVESLRLAKSEKHAEVLLDVMETACQHSKELAHRLLTFAKGGVPILEPCELENLIDQCGSFALSGRKSKLIVRTNSSLPCVMIDRSQIEQVIGNLLINADQAMPDGGNVVVEMSVSSIPSSGKEAIEVTVTDEGEGISPESIHKIFDPYYTTKPTGTGLGLTISYSILKRHQSEMFVESEPGSGTRVRFYLPTCEASDQAFKHACEDSALPAFRVLVVDDDQMVLDSTTALLEQLGQTVVATADPAEAIELASSSIASDQFDVAILDLTLPGKIGGAEVASKISEFSPDTKLVVMSGYHSNPVLNNFQKFGFSAILSKPFRADELVRVICSLMDCTPNQGREPI